MKTEMITKVNKIGNAGLIISRICKVFLCLGIVGCLIGGIALMVIPDDMIQIHMQNKAIVEVNFPGVKEALDNDTNAGIPLGNANSSLSVNGMDYGVVDIRPTEKGLEVEADTENFTVHFRNLAAVVFSAGFYCIISLIVVHFVGALCKLFKDCETPFTEDIVKALRNLAYSLIPMGLFSTITDSVANSIFTGNVKIVLGIDLTTVLMVLLIILLYLIFRYGTMLQQESDETL